MKTLSALFVTFALMVNVAYADTLIVMLDISSSTPVVEPNFMRSALPIVSDKITRLPVGSIIQVMTVGDDKKLPLNRQFYVQRLKDRNGDTADGLSRDVAKMIAGYLNSVRANPNSKMQYESSLSPGFLDASKACQPAKPCQSLFFTDGNEYQPSVIAWPREYQKPLPVIPNLDLKGMNVAMYGIGQCAAGQEAGCATSQQRIAIEQHWTTWLKNQGAGAVDLRRL